MAAEARFAKITLTHWNMAKVLFWKRKDKRMCMMNLWCPSGYRVTNGVKQQLSCCCERSKLSIELKMIDPTIWELVCWLPWLSLALLATVSKKCNPGDAVDFYFLFQVEERAQTLWRYSLSRWKMFQVRIILFSMLEKKMVK